MSHDSLTEARTGSMKIKWITTFADFLLHALRATTKKEEIKQTRRKLLGGQVKERGKYRLDNSS